MRPLIEMIVALDMHTVLTRVHRPCQAASEWQGTMLQFEILILTTRPFALLAANCDHLRGNR